MGKQIQVGGLPVGGGAPVSIQSMTNTPTHDVEATVAQIRRLAAAGQNQGDQRLHIVHVVIIPRDPLPVIYHAGRFIGLQAVQQSLHAVATNEFTEAPGLYFLQQPLAAILVTGIAPGQLPVSRTAQIFALGGGAAGTGVTAAAAFPLGAQAAGQTAPRNSQFSSHRRLLNRHPASAQP